MGTTVTTTVKKWWAILPCFKFETTIYETLYTKWTWADTKFIGSKRAERFFNRFFSMFSIKKTHIIEE